MNSLLEEQMNLFWLAEDQDVNVDAETGNFYFWLGEECSLLSRQEFEDLVDVLNG